MPERIKKIRSFVSGIKRPSLFFFIFVVIFHIAAAAIVYQHNNRYRLNLAGAGIESETFNFYPLTISDDETDTPFKWCYHKSGIVFRSIGRGADYILSLYLRGRTDTPEGRYLRIEVAEKVIFEGEITLDWEWYRVHVPEQLIKSDNLWVILYTKPRVLIRGGGNKMIRGIRVSQAELIMTETDAAITPSSRYLANSLIVLFLSFFVLYICGLRRWRLILPVFLLSFLFSCLMLTGLRDPLVRGVSWLIPNLIMVAILALMVKCVLKPFIEKYHLPFLEGDQNRVALVSTISLALKSGLWFIPLTPSIDLLFHIHMMEKVFKADFLNLSHAGGFHFPYPPGFYMLLYPLNFFIENHFLLIKVGFAFLSGCLPAMIYIMALKFFKDRRAAFYAMLIYVAMPLDFYIYLLGIIANGFGHFMMMLSVLVTALLYDRTDELKVRFLLFIIYAVTLVSHFGILISVFLLAALSTIFLFVKELLDKRRGAAPTKSSLKDRSFMEKINPVIIDSPSLRILSILIAAGGAVFAVYYSAMLKATLRNIAEVIVHQDLSNRAAGLFNLSTHNMLKFCQNTIMKFGLFPFILAIVGIFYLLRRKEKSRADVFIFAWGFTFLIQWWLAVSGRLMLRFELFVFPLVALLSGYVLAKWRKPTLFKAIFIFCVILSLYLWITFNADIQKITSLIIPHKQLEWVLW